ncbi:hypothetical protein DEM27_32560 [Metarhizobium album]|uniref:Uncharacterized protein n=1 Tax=Metarhizobium album TaxID=2182425 RepID=A0A2U2DFT7_9HYPH|nr:hypothetical protein [Rhizobium album]PWE52134.1 hypothetical protein DEM27_32560 [Rhizobium album]
MTNLHVSDHAVLRYLERAHGLDIEAVRRHIAYHCLTGDELRGLASLVNAIVEGDTVVTVLLPSMRPKKRARRRRS